jgi:hypothetical protein
MRENLNQSKTPAITLPQLATDGGALRNYSLLAPLQSLSAAATSDPEISIIKPPT